MCSNGLSFQQEEEERRALCGGRREEAEEGPRHGTRQGGARPEGPARQAQAVPEAGLSLSLLFSFWCEEEVRFTCVCVCCADDGCC